MSRGEEGRLSGLFTALFLASELGDARGEVGGLGEVVGEEESKSASIGATRRPAEVGEARSTTSSTCRCVGSSGCGFGERSTRPFVPGDRVPASGERGEEVAEEGEEPGPDGGVILMNVGDLGPPDDGAAWSEMNGVADAGIAMFASSMCTICCSCCVSC